MARWLRIFDKKRGERRTGSKVLGSVGEALFFSILFLLGSIALVVLIASVWMRSWPASEYFPETYFKHTTCRVIQTRLGEQPHSSKPTTYRPEILIFYRVNGAEYRRWAYDSIEAYSADRESQEAILTGYTEGAEYPCWYDPGRPDQAIVKRGSAWAFWLTVLVFVSFVLIGAGGAVYTVLQVGTSAERRAAFSRRAAPRELMGETAAPSKEHPAVPNVANLINSPGTMLAYRLPMAASPGWTLLASVLFCLVWNFLVTVFVIVAINKHFSGQPDWLLTIVTIPSVGVGIWSIYFAVRRLLMATGVGPTSVEISDHPLRPGREYDIFLTQLGHLSIRSLTTRLVCAEEATFRQGTNLRTEVCCVYDQEIFREEQIKVEPGTPFERRARFAVPDQCMHSFQADNNMVCWSLVVEGDTVGWSTFRRKFPVVVYPGGNGTGNS